MCVYLDDILVSGSRPEEHLSALNAVLTVLSKYGVRLRKEKCTFGVSQVTYLGHMINSEGLHPLSEKVEAIDSAPAPTNITELRSFLGMLQFYSSFLPNLSTMVTPLNALLRHGVPFKWMEEQQRAFNEAKKCLTSTTVLVHFDNRLDVVLSCDASPTGVGAVLAHRMSDGSERPIAYVSRSLSDTERRYAQLDKEALAIVFGVKRFHQYLYGREFKIYTDHKPLLGLLNSTKAIPAMSSSRMQRWSLTLAAYDYQLDFRAGIKNSNADALSRLPLPDKPDNVTIPADVVFVLDHIEQNSTTTATQIRNNTRRDPILSKVFQYVQSGWPSESPSTQITPYANRKQELSIDSGCVLWGSRVIIPTRLRNRVLKELHEVHTGVVRMKALARSFVWWPNLDEDIELTGKECDVCQRNGKTPAEAPLHPWEWPKNPWDRVHIDYAGPIHGSMILVLIDAHSKWIEAHVVNSSTSEVTIEHLMQIFATHGLPKQIVSDNGTCFTSEEFEQFTKKNGIQHTKTAPYHPASNGLAERAVQIIKTCLKQLSGGNMQNKITRFLSRYRITPQSTTGCAPSELLMGRRIRSRLCLLQPSTEDKVQRAQNMQKMNHDYHAKERALHVGTTVYIKNFGRGPKWLAGRITGINGPLSYNIQLLDGRVMKRHQDHVKLRQCDEENELSTEPEPIEHLATPVTPMITPPITPRTPRQPAHMPIDAEIEPPSMVPDRQTTNPNSSPPTPQPRRSLRVRKSPDRLTYN